MPEDEDVLPLAEEGFRGDERCATAAAQDRRRHTGAGRGLRVSWLEEVAW